MSQWSAPQNCINSTLVRKVVIADEKENSELVIRQCDQVVRFAGIFQKNISHWMPLVHRLDQLQPLAPYVGGSDQPLQILIHEHSKNELVLSQDSPANPYNITVSEDVIAKDVAENTGVIERAILFLKLNNGNAVGAAASADFLWSYLKNINNNQLSPKAYWRSQLNSITKYCDSKDQLLIHHEFCFLHNRLKDSFIFETDKSMAGWSLVPIYTKALKDLYVSSDLTHKNQLLKNLFLLGDPEDSFLDNEKLSINESDKKFDNMLKGWLSPLLLPNAEITNLTENFKFNNGLKYNYISVGRSSRNYFPLTFDDSVSENERLNFSDYKNAKPALSEPLIIQFGTATYFYPSDLSLKTTREDLFKPGTIKNVIYVSCEMPEVDSLLEFEKLTKKVIFLKQCSRDDISWTAIARLGIAEYLTQNTKVEFVEYNLSALRLAEKVRGPLKNGEQFSEWQKWLLWRSIVEDNAPSIKRPISSIDGVRRFRIY